MENWKPVVGYEGYYEVSDLGRVRSVDGVRRSGIRFNDHVMHKGRILKQNLKKSGYYTVDLSKDNVIKTIMVHRIVAMSFLPKPVGCDVVNHINCNKKDNRVCNLEWCTAEYNREHAKANNRYYSTRKKAVRCKQNQMEFESSYKAAEWLNETAFKNTRQVSNMACKSVLLVLGINIRLTGILGKTAKSHIRFIDYPVTGVSASALKWDAPRKADGDIVTTSMET